MATITDIARMAGVAISTVSLALRNDPRVRPDTRQRILETAERVHYVSRRHLPVIDPTDRHRVIGLLLPDVSNHYYSRLLRGMLQEAYQSSHQVIVCETGSSMELTCQGISRFTKQQVAGIIFLTHDTGPLPTASLLEMHSHHIIAVGVDPSYPLNSIDQVRTDEEGVARTALEYLTSLGHRQIAFVAGNSDAQIRTRGKAFVELCQHSGIPAHFFRLINLYGNTQIETAVSLLKELLEGKAPPTALIGWDDMIAVLLLQAAHICRVRVPEGLSILGCGNMQVGEYTFPPLTSIEQYPEEIGRVAVRTLLQRVAQHMNQERITPVVTNIAPHIIKRASCAPVKSHAASWR